MYVEIRASAVGRLGPLLLSVESAPQEISGSSSITHLAPRLMHTSRPHTARPPPVSCQISVTQLHRYLACGLGATPSPTWAEPCPHRERRAVVRLPCPIHTHTDSANSLAKLHHLQTAQHRGVSWAMGAGACCSPPLPVLTVTRSPRRDFPHDARLSKLDDQTLLFPDMSDSMHLSARILCCWAVRHACVEAEASACRQIVLVHVAFP